MGGEKNILEMECANFEFIEGHLEELGKKYGFDTYFAVGENGNGKVEVLESGDDVDKLREKYPIPVIVTCINNYKGIAKVVNGKD